MLTFVARTGFAVAKNVFKKKQNLEDLHVQTFRVWPWDTDDMTMLAAPQFSNLSGMAAWGHGFVGGFLEASFRNSWYVVTRRTTFEYFRPIRLFRKFRVHTYLVAKDEFSVLRVYEFYVGDRLTARGYSQLVVLDKSLKKIRAEAWLKVIDHPIGSLNAWPKELDFWKYTDGGMGENR